MKIHVKLFHIYNLKKQFRILERKHIQFWNDIRWLRLHLIFINFTAFRKEAREIIVALANNEGDF